MRDTVFCVYTAAFTYYYDPAILQNKLTPLSIFRDLALRKGDSKKFMFYFYVFDRVYTNIPIFFGLIVYSFMDILGDNVACTVLELKFSKVLTFTISRQKC